MKLSEQFKALENSKVAVILNHKLFGTQKFNVDELHIIDDDERSGITLKNQEIFIYKKDLQFFNLHNNTYILADKRLKIIVNKL
jgi:hypothetical protein